MKTGMAIALGIAGLGAWLLPGWNGLLFPASDTSAGEGQDLGAVLVVGALVLWFMPEKKT